MAAGPSPAAAQASKLAADELRWALHVALVSRWLEPAETEAFSAPFMAM